MASSPIRKGNSSLLSYYLYLFIILWFFILILLGLFWVFFRTDNDVSQLRKRIFNNYESFSKVHKTDILVHNELVANKISNTFNSMKVVSSTINPIVNAPVTSKNILQIQKPNEPIKKMTREEIRKGVWKMTAIEQRIALQNMYELTPPSDKAANAFIEYAKKSESNSIPNWESIRIGAEGKPGDMVDYTIANKKVNIPYGYPEETIFILTASYKDKESASTMARAFARAAHPNRIFIGIHAQNAGGKKSLVCYNNHLNVESDFYFHLPIHLSIYLLTWFIVLIESLLSFFFENNINSTLLLL